jgi:hypothetical protein
VKIDCVDAPTAEQGLRQEPARRREPRRSSPILIETTDWIVAGRGRAPDLRVRAERATFELALGDEPHELVYVRLLIREVRRKRRRKPT